ncbi:MAG: hypothetical protein J6W52_05910 [Bacteroidaceae bacterium]|nr:hypothetical protein [Bacteroidaceae bacterium]
MRKFLLSMAAVLMSLAANAGDGLVAVGANVIVLPSSYYDGDIEWKAWTWVYNSGQEYGDWNTENPNYNVICADGEAYPKPDAAGREWYELGYDMSPKDDDLNWDMPDDEGEGFMQIVWEENRAPFSTDEYFNEGPMRPSKWPSYQWTGNSIMADIYVRRIFTTDQLLSGPVYLACGHDDAPAEYYINGELVFEVTDGWNTSEYIQLTDEQKALIKIGEENVIAFHVHQNWGGAFADCGLYTKLEGGLDMGYTEPWEGKVLFNNTGGYNNDGASPSNNPKHPWSALYEAQEGDVYTFTVPGSCPEEVFDNADIYDDYMNEVGDLDLTWKEQLQFKTPIRIEDGVDYTFKARLMADKPFSNVLVKLTDNDDDEIELEYAEVAIEAPEEGQENYEGTEVELSFVGQEVNNFKIAFDFGGGEEGATVTIKDISLVKEGEEGDQELWVGTHYFNYFYMTKPSVNYLFWDETITDGDGNEVGGYREPANEEEKELSEVEVTLERVDAPEVTGRVETMAWTQPDFDDSMWDDQMMPTGSDGYMPELQSIWPSGILAETGYSSNYWIRRNFELDKINERLSYELNVCHDDVYETYVNGHLLQKNVGWTNGKNPVQVHIPAKYLNVGKNVIATYIQQNWGGYFYDCGINVTEINYEDCLKQFNDVLAYAETDTLLTNRMHEDVKALIAEANQYFNENKNDAAELRNYARELKPRINTIFGYSSNVKTLKDTWDICRKMEDKGYWGTAFEAATAALDTCATASQLNPYLEALRDARKATAMERHTEKYVGSVPQAVTLEDVGFTEQDDLYLPTPLPRYYIYNVGAKLFLGGGESWGTHLVLEYISNAMMLVQAADVVSVDEETGEKTYGDPIEGVYFIETFRPNGAMGEMDFMGWNGYIDCPMNDKWELIPVEGKPNVYNIAQYGQTFAETDTTCYNGTIFAPGGKKLLGLRSGDNRYAPSYYVVDTDMHSPELETNQWMFISREELLGLIKTATQDNPVDLSFLINNPGYDQRLSVDDWIFYNGSVFGRGGDHPNFVLESYNSNEFQNYQEMWPNEGEEALPAGTYVLSVQGYYRDGIEQAHVEKVLKDQPIQQRALLFAGVAADIADNENMPLLPIHFEANNVPGIGYTYGGLTMPGTYNGQPYDACNQAARDYFGCGLYHNELVFTIPSDDPGHLTIGVYKEFDEDTPAGDWIVMDNWRLKYYGKDASMIELEDGINDVIKTPVLTTKTIYNLSGQKLTKAQKGVNIVNGKKYVVK